MFILNLILLGSVYGFEYTTAFTWIMTIVVDLFAISMITAIFSKK